MLKSLKGQLTLLATSSAIVGALMSIHATNASAALAAACWVCEEETLAAAYAMSTSSAGGCEPLEGNGYGFESCVEQCGTTGCTCTPTNGQCRASAGTQLAASTAGDGSLMPFAVADGDRRTPGIERECEGRIVSRRYSEESASQLRKDSEVLVL